ncbi:hypothetical protein L3Q82_018739, partial [Scortum barcoo]
MRRALVIHWAHKSLLTCHQGVKRTMFVIKQRFWWLAMEKKVSEYAAACPVCACNKTSPWAQMGLLHPLPSPQWPWSHISVDSVTGLPPSKGDGRGHDVSCSESMVSPSDIVSDRGPQFISRFWKEFCELLRATVSMSSSYHPQSNGQTELLNQELETCLRCLISQNQASWSDHLTWLEYAHNTVPSAATGLSPFQCANGYQPLLFPANEKEVTVPSAHAMVRRRIWA